MRIAVLQMTSGIDPAANAETLARAIEEAVAGGDVAGQQHGRLVGVVLVAHPQQREGDVDVGVAQAEVPRDGEHGRGHVGRPGPGGEQDLADPEREIEDLVGLAAVGHVS